MKNVKKISFEKSISELEDIVMKLENGDLSLEESIKYFQKGVELSKQCSERLDEVEKKISILIKNDDGNFEEKPFDLSDS